MAKADRITHLLPEDTLGLDPHYAGWFACFNRGQFYEAHDVLEALWLKERGRPDDRFYKGLIQLAGAFVHLQKNRLRPADALFRLAEFNLQPYAPRHHRLELGLVLALITRWRARLSDGEFADNPLSHHPVEPILPSPVSPTGPTPPG